MHSEKKPDTPALTMGEFNYDSLKMDRVPIPNDAAQRLLDWLLEGKRWHANIERVHERIRDFRTEVRASVAKAQAPAWESKAFAMRHPAIGEPMSWRQIAAEVGQPLTSVRRAVAHLEQQSAGV